MEPEAPLWQGCWLCLTCSLDLGGHGLGAARIPVGQTMGAREKLNLAVTLPRNDLGRPRAQLPARARGPGRRRLGRHPRPGRQPVPGSRTPRPPDVVRGERRARGAGREGAWGERKEPLPAAPAAARPRPAGSAPVGSRIDRSQPAAAARPAPTRWPPPRPHGRAVSPSPGTRAKVIKAAGEGQPGPAGAGVPAAAPPGPRSGSRGPSACPINPRVILASPVQLRKINV